MKNHDSSAIDEILSQLGMEYECSDVGNMYRFIDQHGELVRYSAERRGWLEWDGILRGCRQNGCRSPSRCLSRA